MISLFITAIALVNQTAPGIFYYNWLQLQNLLLTGVFSASNLTCLTIAYQSDNSSTVSLLSYVAIVYAILADVFLFDHKFVTMEIVGASIITVFNVVSMCT